MTASKPKPNEIQIFRIYDAPLKIVWDAWNEPDQVAQWWGPRGFTITTHKKDIRTGGMWHYTMHGPDGTEYINKTFYHEVVLYSKMIYDHGGNDEQKPMFRVTVLFFEEKEKTRMEMTMAFPTEEIRKDSEIFIKKANGNSTWDRLAEYLEKQSQNQEIFVINRSFSAPIETIFELWTNPEHLAHWLPPTGFTMKYIHADFNPGGESFYVMSDESGSNKMFGKAQYKEVEKPNRIIYSQQFCDENGKVIRHPMAPTWPESMLTTVVFVSESENQTRITVTWLPVGKNSNEEIDTFVKGRTSMTGGWTGTFDKLDEYLFTNS